MKAMRLGAVLLLVLMIAGCATQSPHAQTGASEPATTMASLPEQEDAAATALVFDPPMTRGIDTEVFAREPRAMGAFVGFETQEATVSVVETDDRQGSGWVGGWGWGWGDAYQRRAYSVRSSTRFR